jgi:hypothetical protein
MRPLPTLLPPGTAVVLLADTARHVKGANVTAQLEKLKALSEWIDKNRTGGENVDDSRDSIYDGTFDSPR